MPVHRSSSYADLMGGFRLVLGGREVTAWRAGRSRALVQYLLVHRERPARPDQLREAIWSHLPPDSGATSVKAAVYGARQALRAVSSGIGPVPAIEFVRGGYVLRADGFSTDVDLFLEAVDEGAAGERAGDPVAAAVHYRRAADAYGGAFLPGEDALWAVEQRERLRTLGLRAIGFLAERARRQGDDWEVIEWRQRALAVDPEDTDAYDSLIDTHLQLGLITQAQRWGRVRQERAAGR